MVVRCLGVVFVVLAMVSACAADADEPLPGSVESTSVQDTSSSEASWDVLVFSHSEGRGIAGAYAPLASEILGVDVAPHDFALGFLNAQMALQHLDGSRYPAVDEVVREAEIIVVGVGPESLDEGWWDLCDPHGPPPGELELLPVPTDAEIAEALGPFSDALDEIVRLRDGEPTVLFGFVPQFGGLVRWQELGIHDLCMTGWEAFADAQADAIEAHGGTVVSFLDVFHGPNHDEDPRARGLIAIDGVHLSEAGIQLAAETLATYPIQPAPLPNP